MSAAPVASAEDLESHRRMVELLAEIAERTPDENPWLGDREVRELRGRLESLPPDASEFERWQVLRWLGHHELRIGEFDEAIRHLGVAAELAPRLQGFIEPKDVRDTVFDLGLAYLRLGEDRNCVAHHSGQSCIFPIAKEARHRDRFGSEKAFEQFRWILAKVPQDLESLWLLNIAAMTLGWYPDEVPPEYRIPPRSFEAETPFPTFENIAPRLGLDTLSLSGGAVFDDFTGDGLLDLLWSSFDTRTPMRFFRNQGDGSFEEASEAAGLSGLLGGLNMVQADYDNDGDLDVLVLRGAWLGAAGRHPSSLLANNGDGSFLDVTFRAGLADVHYPSQTAAWADYDNDGDLDLYVGNEANPQEPYPSQLFRNEGDGTFSEVAAAAGVENLRYTKGVVWGDFDGDRWPDLYVSNLGQENRLYRNLGDGTFEDVAPRLGVAGPVRSFPVWFWDYDNDGILDLYVSSYWSNAAYLAASHLGLEDQAELAALYRGDGEGGFDDTAAAVGLTRIAQPMGANFGDLDYDGFLDFYLGTGFPSYAGVVPNAMYWNRGGQRMVEVTTAGGFGHLQKGHAIAFVDFDHDGDQDVFNQLGGAFPGDAFTDVLFENPGFGHHWLVVQLVGTTSNRSAIGARLRVVVEDGGRRRTIWRWVGSGGSFGANPLRQEIGLGRATRVETLEVYWPTSDLTQTFDDLAVDQFLRVEEGKDELMSYPELPRQG